MKQIVRVGIGLVFFLFPFKGFTQNSNPNAANDYVTVCENSGTINVAVQSNDSDPENNSLTTSIFSGPQHGTAALAGNTINYTATYNYSGQDTIVYVVCDNGIPSLCDTALVVITIRPIPIADAEADQTICFRDSTQIGTPTVMGMNYLWTPSAGLSSNSIAQPEASPATTTTYYLLVTNSATGCVNRDTTIISINPLPIANAGPDHTGCEGDSVLLGTPGISGNTYYWSPILPLNWNSIPQPEASPSTTTTFTLTVTTTLTGCHSSDSVLVTINPSPATNAGPDRVICNGGNVQIGTAAVAGNTYSWSPSAGLSSTTIAQPIASPTVTTTYILTVTNSATGCQDTDEVTVTVGTSPVANAGPDRSDCDGNGVIIGTPAIVGVTYSWSPTTGLSSTTVAQPTANPAVTTSYTVTVTNTASGCTSSDVVLVRVGTTPVANAGPDHTICSGSSVTIGTVAIAGNSYSWSPVSGLNSSTVAQPSAGPTATTTYSVTVTQTSSGCQNSDAVVVTVNPLPVANAGPDKTMCNGDSVQIGSTAVAGNTYSWSPVIGLSSSTVAQPMAHPLITTTYTLTVTNTATGCTGSDAVVVTVGAIVIANAGPDQSSCNGNSVQIGTPAIPGNTYSWSPAAGLSSTTVAQPMANPSATTSYTLTVTNTATGCTNSDVVVVTVGPTVVANAGSDQTSCNGDSVQIGSTAVAGNTYSWSPAIGLSSSAVAQPMAHPLVTTTYTLTVTNTATGCTGSDAVVVTVGAIVIANAGPDQTSCNGDSVQIGTPAIPGNTYSWSPATGLSSTTVAQPTAHPSATTSYTLTVTNTATGCTNSDVVVVTVGPTVIANAGPDQTSCNGDSVQIGSPAVAGNSYSWSPAIGLSSSTVAQPMAHPLVTTTYTLTVTNTATGCTGSDAVVVIVGIAPLANAGIDQSVCGGDSVQIGTPGIPGNTYSWTPSTGLSNDSIAQPMASPSVTTTYIVTLTNTSSGCQSNDDVIVNVNPLPVANAGADVVVCNDSIQIGTPGTAGNTYLWTPAAGLSSPVVAQPMASPLVMTSYTLTVTNPTTGCQNSDMVIVTPGIFASTNAGADQTICSGDSAQIGTTAVAGITYSWSPSTGLSSTTVAQPMASPSSTTTYTLVATNSSGCYATDSVVVNVNSLPIADAGIDQSICPGDSVTIGSPAAAGYTYSWSPSTGLSSSTVAQPMTSPSASTSYTLTVSNSSTSCTNSDTVVVTVYPAPIANAGTDATICAGDSTQIGTTAVAGNTYSWNPSAGLSSSSVAQPNASPSATTTYMLTVSTGNGCTITDTIIVTVNPAPLANAGSGGSICSGDSISIGAAAVPGNTYSWSPSTGLSSSTVSNPMAFPTTTTTYTLTETIGSCSATGTVTVTINIPVADAGIDQMNCAGSSVTLGSPGVSGYTYQWSPAEGLNSSTIAQPTASPTTNTTYTVVVTDTVSGCTSSDEVVFTAGSMEIFNAFSPNGDGVNDWWNIPMTECYSDNEVIIVNRWGNEVWRGKNYNNRDVRWDGKNLNGMDCTDGTYYYIITSNNTEFKGWVLVKR
jgi:gliding motility-associated-like protein